MKCNTIVKSVIFSLTAEDWISKLVTILMTVRSHLVEVSIDDWNRIWKSSNCSKQFTRAVHSREEQFPTLASGNKLLFQHQWPPWQIDMDFLLLSLHCWVWLERGKKKSYFLASSVWWMQSKASVSAKFNIHHVCPVHPNFLSSSIMLNSTINIWKTECLVAQRLLVATSLNSLKCILPLRLNKSFFYSCYWYFTCIWIRLLLDRIPRLYIT